MSPMKSVSEILFVWIESASPQMCCLFFLWSKLYNVVVFMFFSKYCHFLCAGGFDQAKTIAVKYSATNWITAFISRNIILPKSCVIHALSFLFLDIHCLLSWRERAWKVDETEQRKREREESELEERLCERWEKTVEGKSSFPADFNLSAGWAWRFRPYSSRQSRRATASRATGGGWLRPDLVLWQFCCGVCVSAYLCVSMKHVKHF